MKRTRFVLGVALVSSLFWLVGCGQGTYRIPAVEPVVKPKPENDLLEDIESGDKSSGSTETKPSGGATTPAEKAPESKPAAPEAKPEEAKPESTKPAETGKTDAEAKAAAGKPAKAPVKPAGKTGKPSTKK